ncbi:hypothetical protein T265_03666 [Opisthorchis viverrini]|uniref:Uncharacterized protein n=1 Tax=Opisthorchis viverrini TaxID=6198 RepID=A0A075A2J4_OPIVI|nr:hypothetical protein T265_03666 [Opisthorchis viverrini]KER29755.1 hypothetical protein T265_03666 [Opisthorchis viverrini]
MVRLLINLSPVIPFRYLAAIPLKGSTMAGIVPGCPRLDRGSREAWVGFKPRTFRIPESEQKRTAASAYEHPTYQKAIVGIISSKLRPRLRRRLSNQSRLYGSEASVLNTDVMLSKMMTQQINHALGALP